MKRRIGVFAALLVLIVGYVIFRKQSSSNTSKDISVTGANNPSGGTPSSQTGGGSAGNLSPSTENTQGSRTDEAEHALNGGSNSTQSPETIHTKGTAETGNVPTVGSATAPSSIDGNGPGGELKREQGSSVSSNNDAADLKQSAGSGSQAGGNLAQNAAKVVAGESTSSTRTGGTSAASKPVATPAAALVDNTPKASVPDLTCDEQWNQYVSTFKVGADMVYMTNLSVQRPLVSDITTSHIETISQSTSGHVDRDISFSSDHPSGILVLSSLNAAPSVSTSKSSFIAICHAAGGRAASSVLFKFASAKLMDVADDQIKVGIGSFPVYRMKFQAGLLMNEHVTSAMAEIWVAKNKMGLVVKQIIKIPPKAFPDHGSITISSQLAGMRKI